MSKKKNSKKKKGINLHFGSGTPARSAKELRDGGYLGRSY
jgi:hypothetical protein